MSSPLCLSDSELSAALAVLPGWAVDNGQLVHERRFPAYMDGIRFAAAAGEAAERMNHHPDILIQWRKVLLSIYTHSAGGLTVLDIAFAGEVNRIL